MNALGSLAAPIPTVNPPVSTDGREPISVEVTYWVPQYRDNHLGGVPKDYFDSDPNPSQAYTPCTNNVCGPLPVEVYRKLPVLQADGTPLLVSKKVHLKDVPNTPLNGFVVWGGLAAAVGGTIGFVAGGALGQLVLAGVGGALGSGLVFGAIGALRARGDRIKLDWDVYPIMTEDLAGYRERVILSNQDGQQGFIHHFEPDLKPRQVGVYKVPKIVHYKESK